MAPASIDDVVRCFLAVLIAVIASYKGYRRGSLTLDGAVAAFGVGVASLACSWRFGLTLLLFYFSGTKLTRWRHDEKRKYDRSDQVHIDDSGKDGITTSSLLSPSSSSHGRNSAQVLCTTIPAVVAAIAYRFKCGSDCSFECARIVHETAEPVLASHISCQTLLVFYLCFFAGSCGDTWASEIGTANAFEWDAPRLVLPPFRSVPRGTNGGITLVGTIGSVLGGAFMGLVFYVTGVQCVFSTGLGCLRAFAVSDLAWHIATGTLAGVLGSFVDSLLGAVLQASDYDKKANCIVSSRRHAAAQSAATLRISGLDVLSNEAVNLISVTFVSALLALNLKL